MTTQVSHSLSQHSSMATDYSKISMVELILRTGTPVQILTTLAPLYFFKYLIQAAFQLLLIFQFCNLVSPEYCYIFVLTSPLQELFGTILPGIIGQSAAQQIIHYFERRQHKAMRIFTTYTILLYLVLQILLTILLGLLFKQLMKTVTSLEPQMYTNYVLIMIVMNIFGYSLFHLFTYFMNIESRIWMDFSLSMIMSVALNIVLSVTNFVRVANPSMSISANVVFSEVYTFCMLVVYDVTAMVLLFLNLRRNVGIVGGHPCVVDFKLFRPMRWVAFWRIVKLVPIYLLQVLHLPFRAIIFLMSYQRQNNFAATMNHQFSIGMYFIYQQLTEAANNMCYKITERFCSIYIGPRIKRMYLVFTMLVFGIDLILAVVYYLLIPELNKLIFGFDNLQMIDNLRYVNTCVIRCAFGVFMSAGRAYAQTRKHRRSLILLNFGQIIAYLVIMLVSKAKKSQNLVFSLLQLDICDVSIGIFVFLICYKNIGSSQSSSLLAATTLLEKKDNQESSSDIGDLGLGDDDDDNLNIDFDDGVQEVDGDVSERILDPNIPSSNLVDQVQHILTDQTTDSLNQYDGMNIRVADTILATTDGISIQESETQRFLQKVSITQTEDTSKSINNPILQQDTSASKDNDQNVDM